ncbi:diguanylate cyclase [uncultured Photobacterium sp.]|uniref:diguanylate cyclase n=1 Tax=uncultured Photobacterium sp. TaxID=173973 RepID=UPI0026117971|nr:diguanylate cyclase [uncultured Photobacterium sp.]
MLTLLSNNLVLRIQLTLSLFIILTALTISLLWHHSYEQDHRLTIEKLYRHSSETIYNKLDSFFSKVHEVYLHQDVIQEQLTDIVKDREHLLAYLTNALNHHESIDYFYFANTQGGLLSVGQKLKQHFVRFESQNGKAGPLLSYRTSYTVQPDRFIKRIRNFDARQRLWYQDAINNNSPVWSDIYPGVVNNDRLGITLSKALRDQHGEVIGVWGVDLTLSSIEKALLNAKPSKNSIVALIDTNGDILASSDINHRAKNGKLVNITSGPTSVLSELLPSLSQEGESHTSIQSFDYKGETWLNFHTHFPLSKKRSVAIVIYSPESEFTQDLIQTKHYSFIIAALIIMIAVYYGSRRTIRLLTPIRQLTKATEEISQGKWLQKIAVEHDDEVGKLALSFNKMTIHLEATISQLDKQKQETDHLNQKLEERVRERTQELSAANHQLRKLANTDALTGIANQRHFWETFAHRSEENNGWLLILDLDDFKKLNDTFGHVIGDLALKHFTRVCETCLATSDIIGRIGGEEFAIWSEANDVETLTKRILLKLKHSPLHIEGCQIKLSASIGGTDCFPGKVNSYAIADNMLYKAKLTGKKRAVIDSSANNSEQS